MSYCVDANVFITAWYQTYPIKLFPNLYQEIKNKLSNQIIIIKPIFDEIGPLSKGDLDTLTHTPSSKKEKEEQEKLLENHSLRAWLKKEMHIDETPINDDVEVLALELEKKYEVTNISKGASPQDIKLIAFSYLGNHTVVTLEAEQKEKHRKKSNYKIPLICKEENVKCIKFIEMLEACEVRV